MSRARTTLSQRRAIVRERHVRSGGPLQNVRQVRRVGISRSECGQPDARSVARADNATLGSSDSVNSAMRDPSSSATRWTCAAARRTKGCGSTHSSSSTLLSAVDLGHPASRLIWWARSDSGHDFCSATKSGVPSELTLEKISPGSCQRSETDNSSQSPNVRYLAISSCPLSHSSNVSIAFWESVGARHRKNLRFSIATDLERIIALSGRSPSSLAT